MTAAGTLDRATIERIVRQIVYAQAGLPGGVAAPAPPRNGQADELVVSISARHCHLTDEHVEMLFGPGAS